MSITMKGAILPGNSTVELKDFEIPKPGHGQVLVKTKVSTICGSDIRCIYREHTGKGAEGYIPGTIAGHEPCGIIVEEGEGLKRFKKGDRVIVYHISGCGVCYDCRRGYYISCTSKHRQAYGWQRNGGMAPYILCDEKDLIPLPDQLTYKDGAQVACGFGTVYEALEKIGVNGNDAILVTGLGPVGLAALMIAKSLGASKLIGVEMNDFRIDLARKLCLADHVFKPGPDCLQQILKVTGGKGVEKALDASASDSGRQLAIRATCSYGKIAFVGEGGTCNFNPSPDIIHGQKSIYGSWVTSLWKMEELVEKLVRWRIHPGDIITHVFSLEQAGEAYKLMADGKCGKVAVVFDEELEKNGGEIDDGSGLKEDDIQTLMKSSKVSRKVAIKALRNKNGDIVEAAMYIALFDEELEKNDGENDDGSGFKEDDIQALMKSSKVSREIAIKELRHANGDIVEAAMHIALSDYKSEKNDGKNDDGSGLKEDDIQAVMKSSKVSREVAIKALRNTNGDIFAAVMQLAS